MVVSNTSVTSHSKLGQITCIRRFFWCESSHPLMTCSDQRRCMMYLNEDECMTGEANCSSGVSECLNTVGSYICRCLEGYEDVNGTCQDINECSGDPCSVRATCSNSEGSYQCQCTNGFQGDGFSCTDINECNLELDNCSQLCTNMIPGFRCECDNSFYLAEDGISCIAENECISGKWCVNGACFRNADSGEENCRCYNGFTLSSTNTSVCEDVNECDNGHQCDKDQGVCINITPGYTCDCSDGYELDEDQRSCIDIDECSSSLLNNCSDNAECSNTAGSYSCACLTGFNGDGQSCLDINECSNGILTCSNGTCVNETVSCDINGSCENTEGSYICMCNSGYIGTGQDCVDINECMDSACDPAALCIDLEGNYSCSCPNGYTGDGYNTCDDINECNVDNACHYNATCNNIPGSFECNCLSGYRGDGSNCMDVDECTENIDNCHMRASCTNTYGGFSCSCEEGYIGNGTYCENVNECEDNTNECDVNANCTDLEGSYTCTCQMGYYSEEGGNGRNGTCKDYDDCEYGLDNCDPSAICLNSIGSYQCICPSGYEGNGTYCQDINECAISIPCPTEESEKCSNSPGSYACVCQTGYHRTNSSCTNAMSVTMFVIFVDIKGWQVSSFFDDLNQEVVKVSLAIDIDNLYEESVLSDDYLGSTVEQFSDISVGIKTEIRLDLLNNSTYTLTDIEDAFMNGLTGRNNDFLEPDSRILRDNINTTMPIYDQCDEGTHDCFDLNFLECVFVSNNTFTCANCKAGYQQVGSICDDVDECQDDPCSYLGAAECINTISSYICQCQNDTVIVDDVCTAYNQTSPYFVRNEILGFKSGSVVPYYISFFHPTAVNVTTDTLESALLSAVEGDKVYSSPRNLYVVLEVNTIEFEDFVETCPDAYCSNGGTCMVDFVYDKVCMDLCEVPLTTTTVPTTFTNQPPTITNQPPVSLFPVVAIILGIVIGFLLVLIFFLCCGLVVYTRSRQQHEKLQYKYTPSSTQNEWFVISSLEWKVRAWQPALTSPSTTTSPPSPTLMMKLMK
ncbi:putative fibrillin-1 [Apostichopus japonicus]|uniref:Putative fibrillin-1 n=1 Tax=Stichopus japonicus TaxID=307972 RepID=A0A2G8JF60_STIJA|nr:putative fibrillin-1 [Apostichopus japonicus]